jgi:hypothetical protein
LFILAELIVNQRMRLVVAQFVNRGLVPDHVGEVERSAKAIYNQAGGAVP